MRDVLWASRNRNGEPCVPFRVIILEDQTGMHGESLVIAHSIHNQLPYRLHSTWLHETFAEARAAALQACNEMQIHLDFVKPAIRDAEETHNV